MKFKKMTEKTAVLYAIRNTLDFHTRIKKIKKTAKTLTNLMQQYTLYVLNKLKIKNPALAGQKI